MGGRWDSAMEQFDRLLSPPLDDIRRLSNAALVIGIGGTMGIFLVEALSLPSLIGNISENDLPAKIIAGTIPALLSSLLGVGFHLYISLSVLNKVQKNVISKERELLLKVSTINNLPPPVIDWPQDVKSFGSFVEAIQSVLNQQHSFIAVLSKRLKQEVSIARVVLENQETLKGYQSEMLDILKQVRPSHFLGAIEGTLKDMQKWSETQQESAVAIHKDVEGLTKGIGGIPEHIRESLNDIEELGAAEFRWLSAELNTTLESYINELSKKLNNERFDQRKWLSEESEKIVRDILESIRGEISKNLTTPLEGVASRLERITDDVRIITEEMPRTVKDYTQYFIDSTERLSTIPGELEKVAGSIDEVLSSATSKSLDPLSVEMQNFVCTVEETHTRLSNVIQHLIGLIENLIGGIEVRQ